MKKVLVTGSSGMIGSRLVELNQDYDLLTPSLEELDLTDPQNTSSYLSAHKPELIINLAGYTNTQKAELERDHAELLNVRVVENLVKSANQVGAKLVHISTDFVFDGVKGDYKENDEPHPLTVYGETKYRGEEVVKSISDNWLIIRTAYPYRAAYDLKSDCVRWMLPKLQKGEEVTLVTDQTITPTFVDDFVSTLWGIIERDASGIYHVAGSQCLSFYEMGLNVADIWGFDRDLIKETTLEQFAQTSGRSLRVPQRSCLNTSKIESELGLLLSDFKTGLTKMKKQMEVA